MAFPTWLIVPAILIIALIILFRSMNQIYVLSWLKDNFFYFFLIAVLLFFTFSLTKLHKNYDLDLTSSEGFKTAGKIYLSWFVNVFKNVGKITGYAVQQDWTKLNANNTNSSIKKSLSPSVGLLDAQDSIPSTKNLDIKK